MPVFGLTNHALLTVDPVTGDILEFQTMVQAKHSPGSFTISQERAQAIARQTYLAERHLIAESLDDPVPKSTSKGFGVSQEHTKLPYPQRKDLPAIPAYKFSYDDETKSFVVVAAGDGAILWRSWRVYSPGD